MPSTGSPSRATRRARGARRGTAARAHHAPPVGPSSRRVWCARGRSPAPWSSATTVPRRRCTPNLRLRGRATGLCNQVPRPVPSADVPADVAAWAGDRDVIGSGALWTARSATAVAPIPLDGGWYLKFPWITTSARTPGDHGPPPRRARDLPRRRQRRHRLPRHLGRVRALLLDRGVLGGHGALRRLDDDDEPRRRLSALATSHEPESVMG